jgi:hypothetical protein
MTGTKFFLLIRKPKLLCTTRKQSRAHRDFSVPAILKTMRLPENWGARQAFQCEISLYFHPKMDLAVKHYYTGCERLMKRGGAFLREEPRTRPRRGVEAANLSHA